jgi:hypothetical protein
MKLVPCYKPLSRVRGDLIEPNDSTQNLVGLVGIHLESTWNLVGLGSTWIQVNLVGMVGIWWEFGGNDSQSK